VQSPELLVDDTPRASIQPYVYALGMVFDQLETLRYLTDTLVDDICEINVWYCNCALANRTNIRKLSLGRCRLDILMKLKW
jgi:hypothetical protein